MMNAIITPTIALLGQLIPVIGTNSTLITSIIETLTAILPTVVKEVQQLVPPIKNIIASLSSHPVATEEQMAALKALDQQCDAAFDEAIDDPAADAEG